MSIRNQTEIGAARTTSPLLRRAVIEPLESRIAPATLTAINVDTFAPGGDLDGDGKADLGDVIRYTVTLENTSGGDLSNVTFSDLLDPNTTLLGVNVSPLAINDAYTAVGNTLLVVGNATATGPAALVAGNVLLNDLEFLGDTYDLVAFDAASANGGTVAMTTSGGDRGGFTFLPKAGFTGVDTFTYTLKDKGLDGIAGTADDLTSVGTVSITVSQKVWYVDSSAIAGGDGRSSSPFNSLTPLNGVGGSGDVDGVGDIIYVKQGSGSYGGGINLENNQTLHGAGVALQVNGFTLQTAGSSPTITNTSGVGITLASGNTIKSVLVANTSGAGILGSGVTGASFDNISVVNPGAAGLSLSSFSGSLLVSGSTTITGATTTGINVSNSGAGSMQFGATTVSGTAGINLATSGSMDFSFGSLTATSNNGAALIANGVKTLSILGSSNALTSTGGPALDLTNAPVLGGVTFSSVTVNSSTTTGMSLDNVTGTVTVNGGSIQQAAGADVKINGGTVALSYAGSITNTSGRAIDINAHSSGAITLSGNITDAGGAGISITNNTGGTITLSGATKNLNTGGNAAVTLANNAGTTVNFSGDLDIITSSAAGFTATAGGTVNITGAGNTISSTSGTALNFANTGIGASGLRFQSISSGAGNNVGISLVNTGSAGGLTVTGLDGGDANTVGDAGSGGTISGKTGADGSTAGVGIYLENTGNVSLTGMNLSNFQNFAIRGSSVTNFALAFANISGTSGNNVASDEGAISFTNLAGVGSIYDSNISGAYEFTVNVVNTNTTLNQFTVGRSTLGAMDSSAGDDALHFEGLGSGTMNLLVHDSTFTSARGDLVSANAGGTVSMDVQLLKNTFNNTNPAILSGGGGVTVTAGGAGSNTTLTYNISGNSFSGAKGFALLVAKGTGAGSANGTIFSNTFGTAGVQRSASSEASAIDVDVRGSGSHTVLIKNNTINGWGANGAIQLFANQGGATMNATVIGNFTGTPDSVNALAGLYAEVGALSTDTNVLNLKLGGSGTEQNNFVNGDPFDGNDVLLSRITGAGTAFNLSTGGSGAGTVAGVVVANNVNPITVGTGGTITLVGSSPALPAPINESIPTPQPLIFSPTYVELPAVEVTSSGTDSNVTSPEILPPSGGVGTENSTAPVIVDDGVLSQSELDSIVSAAINRWSATGLTADQVALLHSVRFEVANMTGWYLGSAGAGVVTLDSNAGGNAWFIDSTPLDDTEFTGTGGQKLAASGVAANRVDALTTVMHELGHVLGLEDHYDSTASRDIMYGVLGLGERRLPLAGQADGITPHTHSDAGFLFSPVNIGTLPTGKSITIMFDAKVNNTFTNPLAQISNQGTFTFNGGSTIVTDDPSTVAANDPTITAVDLPDVTIGISPVSVMEDGSGNLVYTFTRQGPTTDPLTVSFAVGGTAGLTGDYSVSGHASYNNGTGLGTLAFAAGSDTATLTVASSADSNVEENETVQITIQSGTGYDVGSTSLATGTIANDDTDVTIAVSPASVSEDGAGNLVYTFTRTGVTNIPLTVNFGLSGTATEGLDFTASGAATLSAGIGTVFFAANQTVATVTIDPISDLVVESNETAVLTLNTGTGYNLGTNTSATGTITNDDAEVTVSLAPVAVDEDGSANLVYTFTRTGAIDGALTVNYTVGGTATFGSDYTASEAGHTATTGTITFAAGSPTATLTLDPIADATAEADETIALGLAAGTGYAVGAQGSATGTIRNDDTAVSIAVGSPVVNEGGGSSLVYTFTRTGDTGSSLLVNFNVGGAAVFTSDYLASGAASFSASAGTIVIPAGSSTATLSLTPENDTKVEGSEIAAIAVASGAGYNVVSSGPATGTILDNDTATISFTSSTRSLGESAGLQSVGLSLVITANGVVGTGSLERDVTAFVSGSGITATAGSDFDFVGQPVTFLSGSTSGARNLDLTINDDVRVEGSESLKMQIDSLSDGTISQVSSGIATQTITITDNDTATVGLSSTSGGALEDSNGAVQVVLTVTGNGVVGVGTIDVPVSVSLNDLLTGTALPGASADYVLGSSLVTFAAGSVSGAKSVEVSINNDTKLEGSETIKLELGTLADGSGGQVSLGAATQQTFTITDNESATLAFVSSASTFSENAGAQTVEVELVITANGLIRSGTLEHAVSINVQDLLTGTASAGTDYAFTSPQVLTFAAGDGSSVKTAAITIVDDVFVEGGENLSLGLGALTDGTGSITLGVNKTHSVAITDNDTAVVTFSAPSADVLETSGTYNAGVQLTIIGNGVSGVGSLERAVSVNVTDVMNGDATAAADYTYASPQTITFAAGATTSAQNFSLGIINDTKVEGSENIFLQLAGLTDGSNGQVSLGADAGQAITISDNDIATLTFENLASSTTEGSGTHAIGVKLVITANGVIGQGTLERPVSISVQDTATGTAVPGTDYTYSNPQVVSFNAGEGSSTKTVSLGTIDDAFSEGNETIEFQLANPIDGTAGQVNVVSSEVHRVTLVDNDVDLQVSVAGSSPTVIAGSGVGNLLYTVTVKNVGLTDASGVVIGSDLNLPSGVSVISVTTGTGTFIPTTDGDGNWQLGSLAAGAQATLVLTLTAGASAPEGGDLIGASASLSAIAQSPINPADDIGGVLTSIDRQVDLQVQKSNGATGLLPGQISTYAISVTNAGLSDATGVVLTETLPLGTRFNEVGSTAGWTETQPGSGVYVFDLGTVGGNANAAPVNFAVTVTSPVNAGLAEIVNRISIGDDGSAGADLTPADNEAADTDPLNANPHFTITIADDVAASVAKGGIVHYTITFANSGNQDATGVFLRQTLPANSSFDSAESDPRWVLQSDGSYRLDVGEMDAGAGSQTAVFAVRVDPTIGAVRAIDALVSLDDDGQNAVSDLAAKAGTSTPIYQGIYVVSPGIALPKKGAPGNVLVFDASSGLQTLSFFAYDETYRDSVRIAVGDFNGDGFDDIVTATRNGNGNIRLWDGTTGEQMEGPLASIQPFDGKKERGAYVAAGDLNGDGIDDLVIGSALGGGKVKVFDGASGSLVSEYQPFGKSYKGGVRVAVGDVNGDGVEDVVTAQGNFGSRVVAYDGDSTTVLQDFKVGGKSYRGGVSVAVGDLNGDGVGDIIAGRNGKSKPLVETFSGADGSKLASFLAFSETYRNGVRVGAVDVNVDGIADIIVGAGYKGRSEVKIFNGATAEEMMSFTAFTEFPDVSLFVAGSSPVPSIIARRG